jgi:hypothetical protein
LQRTALRAAAERQYRSADSVAKPKRKDKGFAADYINVDLEIRSRTNLRPLADALSRRLFWLYVGRADGEFLATFENGSGAARTGTPDLAIQRLVRVVDSLSPEIKRHWTSARDRVFDIGVAKAWGAKAFHLSVRATTVAAVARLKARIALTFYPPYYPDPRGAAAEPAVAGGRGPRLRSDPRR